MVSIPKLGRRVKAQELLAVAGHDVRISKLTAELQTRYEIPQAKAENFIVAVAKVAFDGMGARTLGKISKRFTSIAQLRSQIGKALESVLSGTGEGAAVGKNLRELFGQVRRELDGLQAEIQTRELGGIVEELQAKLKHDLEGAAPALSKGYLLQGEFYEPPGFLKEAYGKLSATRRKALNAASSDGQAAAFLQKALTAEDQFQAGYVKEAQARMRDRGMAEADINNLPDAVEKLAPARRKSLINDRETLEGRMRADLLDNIQDEQLRDVIKRDDFLLLPSAADEYGGALPFALDKKPSTTLSDAWAAFKDEEGIAAGAKVTNAQARKFREHWRKEILGHEVRAQVSERGSVWEIARHEKGWVMKPPKGRAKDRGTDFIESMDNGELWIADDKAWSTDTVTHVSAFTHKLYEDVASDVVQMRQDLAQAAIDYPNPDATMQAEMHMARTTVDRYEAFGKDLENVTQTWEKGEAFDDANAKAFKAVLDRHNVKLKVTGHLGVVTKVTERLKLLDIAPWSAPVGR